MTVPSAATPDVPNRTRAPFSSIPMVSSSTQIVCRESPEPTSMKKPPKDLMSLKTIAASSRASSSTICPSSGDTNEMYAGNKCRSSVAPNRSSRTSACLPSGSKTVVPRHCSGVCTTRSRIVRACGTDGQAAAMCVDTDVACVVSKTPDAVVAMLRAVQASAEGQNQCEVIWFSIARSRACAVRANLD